MPRLSGPQAELVGYDVSSEEVVLLLVGAADIDDDDEDACVAATTAASTFACAEHAPLDVKREPQRHVLRYQAEASDLRCQECGQRLSGAPVDRSVRSRLEY